MVEGRLAVGHGRVKWEGEKLSVSFEIYHDGTAEG
jgi:hypothetical protein